MRSEQSLWATRVEPFAVLRFACKRRGGGARRTHPRKNPAKH